MTNFVFNKRFKSIALEISDIDKLLEVLEQIVKEDNKNKSYRKEIDLNVDYTDGKGLKSNNPKEYTEFLSKNSKNRVASLSISYWGYSSHLRLYASQWSPLTLSIEASKKEKLLNLEDDIANIFVNWSWNWICHTFLFQLIFGVASWLGALLLLVKLLPKFTKENFELLGKLSPILFIFLYPILSKISNIYPEFVLKPVSFRSGRILKNDLIKIIGFVVTLIIIPLILNQYIF